MEELLLGGNIGGAVRVDDTVRRVAGPHTSTVHRLLRHLRTHGFPEAPEPLGVDDRGREVLRFVAGDVPSHPLPSWVLSDDAPCSVGRLLRRFHDATLSFTASRNPHWQRLPGAPSHGDVICHNDLAPYNTVYREGRAVALIDWDYAAPGTRQWDIAHAAWRHVPIGEHTPVELAAPRLSLLCDAYGLTERAGLVDVIADRAGAARHRPGVRRARRPRVRRDVAHRPQRAAAARSRPPARAQRRVPCVPLNPPRVVTATRPGYGAVAVHRRLIVAILAALAWSAGTAHADWSGDGRADVLAIDPTERLLLYRGDGAGGWLTGTGEPIGTGWGAFTALFSPGDFSGDGKPDLLVRRADGALLLYRGNGAGGWLTGAAEPIGAGWQPFTAVLSGGEFSGDGKADVLARQSDGVLLLYRGNGAGGWVTGIRERIGSGWGSLGSLTLAAQWRPPPAPPAPPSAPLPDGRVRLSAGIRCTPPGGKLRVSLRVRRRPGRAAPRVLKVAFFTRGGKRRVDRSPPYVVRLRVDRPPRTRGRVYARVAYRREGSRQVRHKTVSRRFVMCR